ncbi:MAG: FAD-binding oxidoreductase [bacterium]|nr:FAD-binding oxidoreductase [bacterium]
MPTWDRSVSLPAFQKLTESSEADIVIIGGGLTGLLSAYLLSKAGKRVALLEKGVIGSGATGVTTGFLTQSIDTNFADLIWMLGEERAKLIIKSHGEAIGLIEKIVADEKIECEFTRCDNFVFANRGTNGNAALTDEQKAAHLLGLEAALEPASTLPFSNVGSLRIGHQAKFHPLKFLAGLAIAAQKAGAIIYEHSEVSNLETNKNGVTIHVGHERIKATWALSATYEPFREPWGLYFKKGMYVSYVMELSAPRGSLPEATYEDSGNPYHYFRVDRVGSDDRIIIGGEDHRLDIPVRSAKNFVALETYVRKTFPLFSYKVITRWQGRVLEPIDGLAFIGPYQNEHVWYAFGFSGNGMTYAPIAARMFCDAVVGYENPWRELYNVGRIPGAKSLWVKGRDFAGEFVHGALKNTFTSSVPLHELS